MKGEAVFTRFQWDDAAGTLKIQRNKSKVNSKVSGVSSLRIKVMPDGPVRTLDYTGKLVTLDLRKAN
jgi:hypothetical protein